MTEQQKQEPSDLNERIADQETRIAQLEKAVRELQVPDRLNNAYAFGNVHKSLLIAILADVIEKDSKPASALQAFYNDACHEVRTTPFPDDVHAQEIQRQAIKLVASFFRVVEDILVSRGKVDNQDRFLANACPD